MRAEKEKEREDGEVRSEEDEGSVFILVQVSLFIEVVIFWGCKAFLRCQKGKKKKAIQFLTLKLSWSQKTSKQMNTVLYPL